MSELSERDSYASLEFSSSSEEESEPLDESNLEYSIYDHIPVSAYSTGK